MGVSESEVVARAVQDAVRSADFVAASRHLSSDAQVINVATGDVFLGPDGYLQFARGWTAAFPDARFEVSSLHGSEEGWTLEYRLEGTHTGPLITPRGHVPPTGAEVMVPFCDTFEIRDGYVTALRSYFDTVTLLRQLGLIAGTPIHAPERRAPLELYVQAVDENAPQRHKAIVHRFLQDVFNRQNPDAAADTCGADYVWHGGVLGEARGLKAYQAVLGRFFHAFPDMEIQVHDTLAERDQVVVRFAISGTHLGSFHGIPATMKHVVGGGTNTYRLEENRVVEEWWQGDLLVLIRPPDLAPSSNRLSS
jgi:predicted ester cyclase